MQCGIPRKRLTYSARDKRPRGPQPIVWLGARSLLDLEHRMAVMAMKLRASDFTTSPLLDYETWRAAIRSAAGRYNPEAIDRTNFAGRVCVGHVYGFDALHVDHNGHRIQRTQRDVRLDGVEDYYIVVQVVGQSTIMQNDQVVTLDVGSVALIDSTRPVTYTNEAYARWLSLRLPRRSLMSYLGFDPRGGCCGHRRTRAGRVLFELLLDAFEDDLNPTSDGVYMHLAIYDLLGALFAPSDLLSISPHSDKLFARVSAIIRHRFADPEVGPCEVAGEAGISLRYLQKLFTQRGSTCGKMINSMRLNHAARLLRRRAISGTNQSIAEIAYACGFNDYNHFSRNFSQRFGHAPSVHVVGDIPIQQYEHDYRSLK
jgi:AraC family transcriptional regulator, positive regulator of tynA and feaB